MGRQSERTRVKQKHSEGTDALEGRGWDEIKMVGKEGADRGVARLAFRRVKVIILFFFFSICCRFTFSAFLPFREHKPGGADDQRGRSKACMYGGNQVLYRTGGR